MTDLRRAAADLDAAGLALKRAPDGCGTAWLRCKSCGYEFDVILSVYLQLPRSQWGCPPCSVATTEQGGETEASAGRRKTTKAPTRGGKGHATG